MIIKQIAPQPPYSIKVTEKGINLFLKEMARGESRKMSETEFKSWYRQRLEAPRFAEAEYRDVVRSNLLRQLLTLSFGGKSPTVAEQV